MHCTSYRSTAYTSVAINNFLRTGFHYIRKILYSIATEMFAAFILYSIATEKFAALILYSIATEMFAALIFCIPGRNPASLYISSASYV